MTALAVLAGTGLVLLVGLDIVLTILHPSVRGPVSHRLDQAAWSLTRALARGTGRRGLLTFAGPGAVLATVLWWIGGLWAGFALVYLPEISSFVVQQGVPFGGPDAVRALYASGVALTTVGFGDVVAPTDPLRLATTVQAGAGLAAFTAAITYVLSVYPSVTVHRAAAQHAHDLALAEPLEAARVAVSSDHSAVEALQEDLVELGQHLRRFPVLYYFDAEELAESPVTLLRGALVLTLVLRWGVAVDALPTREFQGRGLETSLRRLMADFEGEYVGGRGDGGLPEVGEQEVRGRLQELREAVGRLDPELARPEEDPPAEVLDLARRAHAFSLQLAREHLLERSPHP